MKLLFCFLNNTEFSKRIEQKEQTNKNTPDSVVVVLMFDNKRLYLPNMEDNQKKKNNEVVYIFY